MLKLITLYLLLAIFSTTINAQNCGIAGADASKPIVIQTIPDSTPPGEEIWRSKVFNVHNTTAVSHPHYKYITAYKLQNNDYYFKTSNEFPNFIQNEGTNVILRSVTFHCLGGGSTLQQFEIPVLESDKFEPKFLKTEYSLQITENWPLTKTINQGALIIVGDSDIDLINAQLTFRSNFEDEDQNSVIRVVGKSLWSNAGLPPSGLFYYRVELYLETVLAAGDYEFILFASSRLRSGSTVIKLRVV